MLRPHGQIRSCAQGLAWCSDQREWEQQEVIGVFRPRSTIIMAWSWVFTISSTLKFHSVSIYFAEFLYMKSCWNSCCCVIWVIVEKCHELWLGCSDMLTANFPIDLFAPSSCQIKETSLDHFRPTSNLLIPTLSYQKIMDRFCQKTQRMRMGRLQLCAYRS